MWLFSQDLDGKCVKWYGSGSEKGDKQENAGKRCGPSPRFPAPLSPDTASTSSKQAASQARSRPVKGFGLPRHHARNHKGADYHGQTLSPPTPSNRPSVAVYFAPLFCRLLLKYTIIIQHLHQHPSIPLQPYPIPQTCPTRSPLPLPPTRSLPLPNRRRKHRTRLWHRPQDRPSRRNRVTM